MEVAPQEVHLWWADLNFSRDEQEQLVGCLSDGERTRAAKFKVDEPRQQFTGTRGALRMILARYVNELPANIHISQTGQGKPYLTNDHRVFFNLAHVADRSVIAIGRAPIMGVDLEAIRPNRDLDSLAKRVFSTLELEEYLLLPVDERVRGFYCGWTRKEAYLKAIGVGIGASLREFAINLTPDKPARLLWVKGKPAEPRLWTVQHLDVSEEMVGALAVREIGIRQKNFRFHPPYQN